ncbi:MAG: prepilin-type N-terminal cleavage/methylation domain-containing protein [Kiritimatiellia bacterium]
MKPRETTGGFTLLELLVTLAIVAGVVAVILACFEAGFRVYARIRDFGSREAEVYLASEILARDLSYVIPGADNRFRDRELYFTRLGAFSGLGQIIHIRAPSTGGLYYWAGSDTLSAAGRMGARVVPEDFAVRFLFASPDEGEVWLHEWAGETNLPMAVRMVVSGADPAVDPFVRTIVLYGNPLLEEEGPP